MNDSFAEKDLQLKAYYASLPCCTKSPISCKKILISSKKSPISSKKSPISSKKSHLWSQKSPTFCRRKPQLITRHRTCVKVKETYTCGKRPTKETDKRDQHTSQKRGNLPKYGWKRFTTEWKETNICEKRHKCEKRDTLCGKRPSHERGEMKEVYNRAKRNLYMWKETYMCEKRHMCDKRHMHVQGEMKMFTTCWKETYICEKRHICVKRDVRTGQEKCVLGPCIYVCEKRRTQICVKREETYLCQKRPMHERGEMNFGAAHVYMWKVTYICEKWRIYVKWDLSNETYHVVIHGVHAHSWCTRSPAAVQKNKRPTCVKEAYKRVPKKTLNECENNCEKRFIIVQRDV